MSVQDLRARIIQLETEIDIHPEALKKLQHEKLLVQHQLNTILDPIALLPLEISSEIFHQSLLPRCPPPQPKASHSPMLLLNVCKTWTDIALSTTSLWTGIWIEFPCSDSLAQLLSIWFQRARNQPLSVFL
ncbi:F-box domain-containing protein [Mycena sanguinolenta]|uniref:F-box domain-containing protein n=1 Tax=Mycena sanguinolenta TaxID=230812 RepID=A0A8H6YM26_9AGAR|nr:F-box domain-containing protein [Mycena sanguinolenta]